MFSLLLAACIPGCQARAPGAAAPVVMRHHLSGEANDWEPFVGVGGEGRVAVVAVRKAGTDAGEASALHLNPVLWISDDRGETFREPVTPSDALDFQGDPGVRVDGHGNVYASWIAIDWDSAGMPDLARGGLVLARSTDGGRTFASTTAVPLGAGVGDKPVPVVSPDGKDVYVAFTGAGGTLDLAVSRDGGASWSRQRADSTAALYWVSGAAIGPDGTLRIVHPRLLGALTDTLAAYDLELVTSRDGGRTWEEQTFSHSTRLARASSPEELPLPVCTHGAPCPRQLPYPAVTVDGVNRVYLAYTEGSAGRPFDLRFRRSDDGGRTWTDPRVISAAPRPLSGDQSDHYYPMIAAGGGLLYVVWFDDRTGALNVWARSSADAGETWSEPVRLSRDDRDGFTGIYGEYGGAAVDAGGVLHAVWAEGSGHVAEPAASGGVWYARWDGQRQ